MNDLNNSLFSGMANQKLNAINRQQNAISNDQGLSDLTNAFYGKKSKQTIEELPLDRIIVKKQVRTNFIEDEIQSLAESIKENGLLQPIVVYAEGNNYRLICGEKRYRAVTLNGDSKIKAIVISEPKNEKELLALQIVENLHRSDPPVVDIANAIRRLKENEVTVDEIGKMIGMGKSQIYGLIAVGKLDDIEKATFKEMSYNFLSKFVALKKSCEKSGSDLPDIIVTKCNETLSDLEVVNDKENTKEKRVELIKKVFDACVEKAKKIKAKELDLENSKSDVEIKDTSLIGKKLSLSWEKIDKIEPDLSSALNDFLEKTNQSLEDVIANALSQYIYTSHDNT